MTKYFFIGRRRRLVHGIGPLVRRRPSISHPASSRLQQRICSALGIRASDGPRLFTRQEDTSQVINNPIFSSTTYNKIRKRLRIPRYCDAFV